MWRTVNQSLLRSLALFENRTNVDDDDDISEEEDGGDGDDDESEDEEV